MAGSLFLPPSILTVAMNVVKSEILRFPVSADEVDGPVGILDGLHERFLVSHVDGHEKNLTQIPADFETLDFVGITAVRDNHLGTIDSDEED